MSEGERTLQVSSGRADEVKPNSCVGEHGSVRTPLELDYEHLAFSILHGTFDREPIGGCSCNMCVSILSAIETQKAKEFAEYEAESRKVKS